MRCRNNLSVVMMVVVVVMVVVMVAMVAMVVMTIMLLQHTHTPVSHNSPRLLQCKLQSSQYYKQTVR